VQSVEDNGRTLEIYLHTTNVPGRVNKYQVSTSPGIAYRFSRNLADTDDTMKGALYGDTILGVVEGRWLAVRTAIAGKQRYLPLEKDGEILLDMSGRATAYPVSIPSGIAYRFSKKLTNRDDTMKGALYGDTIFGVVEGSWLAVTPATAGNLRYLPLEKDGEILLECLAGHLNAFQVSTSSGIAYRFSRNLADRDDTMKGALYGDTIRGVVEGSWLAVKLDGWSTSGQQRYLPLRRNGQILLKCLKHREKHQTPLDGPLERLLVFAFLVVLALLFGPR